MDKSALQQYCLQLIQNKLKTVDKDLEQLKISAQSDSKSAMGDKYETSTELINQERNKLESVKSDLLNQIALLNKIEYKPSKNGIGFGDLAKTSNGYFYFTVPLGIIEFNKTKVACISIKSPIAQNLMDKKQGDKIIFNGNEITISEVH